MSIRFFSFIFLIMMAGTLKAQLFTDKTFYANTATITRQSMNGSGGKGFWALQTLDSLGRTIVKDYYRYKKHLQQDRYTYNDMNDITTEVVVFDIHDKNRNDTTRYEYVYEKGRIIYQKKVPSNQDSTIIKLVTNEGDSVLRYTATAYNYVPDKKIWIQTAKRHVASVVGGKITQLLTESINNDLPKLLIRFEYDDEGKLIRRQTEGNTPEAIILGSPEGPLREYRYEYDRKGRVTKMYSIMDGKSIQLAAYSYQ